MLSNNSVLVFLSRFHICSLKECWCDTSYSSIVSDGCLRYFSGVTSIRSHKFKTILLQQHFLPPASEIVRGTRGSAQEALVGYVKLHGVGFIVPTLQMSKWKLR